MTTNYLFSVALAEILSKREMPNGSTHYYVHYIDCEYEIICVLLKKGVVLFRGLFASTVRRTSEFFCSTQEGLKLVVSH